MKIPSDKDIVKLFGRKIKELREGQGLSQSQLAFEAKMPREQIGRIERGQVNTGVKNIGAIALALNLKPKDLFDF